MSIKREYWLLYSFYTSFYLSQGDLENAKRSLDQASSYADSNWVEGDYAINTYLTVKARYHKAAGDIPLALHCINEVRGYPVQGGYLEGTGTTWGGHGSI